MYAYYENGNNAIIEREENDINIEFNELVARVLEALDGIDSYNISEGFECYGFSDGYLRIYNLNRNVVYRLWNSDIEKLNDTETIRLEASEPTEDDINNFNAMY